ncbi:MAG: PaaI family thioesterase [Candidatus Cloacimonadota bacterium]|nr:PaaI family thioesterase [Candidatus Cloacimonadota bacterium]
MPEKIENYCFGCSQENPIGLKLKFSHANNETITEWKPTREYEGFPGILHGGIIATIIDEVMAKAIENMGIWAVTVEMNVQYLKKTEIGKKLIARARFVEKRKKILYLKAEILNEQGEVTANGIGKYFFIKEAEYENE